jgi:peptidoglycan/xylan/chitin deacetylase (PgdA/CDA1 family)
MFTRALMGTLAPGGPHSRLSVLIFHRVLEQPDPLLPGEPDAAEFETQMRWVRRWFNVLPLPEAVERLARGDLPARPLSITFDDGYADNHTVASGILRKLGLTATFFIATRFLNGGRMWNDTVIETIRVRPDGVLDLRPLGLGEHVLDSVEARRRAIASILNSIRYLAEPARASTVARIAEHAPGGLRDNLMMSDAQVKDLHRSGMTIGAHTASHPILARLSPEAARAEIVEGRRALENIIGEPVRLFAYPNGKPRKDYTAEHVSMVKDLGFSAAVTTAWGAAQAGCDLYQLPRFTPWDRSGWKYGMRLAHNLTRGVAA